MLAPTLTRRHALLPVFAALLFSPIFVHAAPTAVNDNYSTAEDTPLTVSAGGGATLLSDTFAANISGWAYANSIFGATANNGINGGNWTGAAGNPAGGLTLNRQFAGVVQGTRSAGFSKTFTLATAQTVRITLDTQITVSGAGATAVAAQSRTPQARQVRGAPSWRAAPRTSSSSVSRRPLTWRP